MSDRTIHSLFLRQSTNRFIHDYLPKLRRCLERLDEEQVWWRPNEETNSIGNLLLHLAGNVRQWIVNGITERPDDRERDAEFAARGGPDKEELISRLEATVDEAVSVIAGLTAKDLLRDVSIQGYKTGVLAAVYHVVEHFSGHVGQVVWMTKMLRDEDLRFYAH